MNIRNHATPDTDPADTFDREYDIDGTVIPLDTQPPTHKENTMTWTTRQCTTITDQTIEVVTCDGLEIKYDDLGLRSNATIVVPPQTWIDNVDELAAGGFEITFTTGHVDLTVVLPFTPQYFDNAIQAHLRGDVSEYDDYTGTRCVHCWEPADERYKGQCVTCATPPTLCAHCSKPIGQPVWSPTVWHHINLDGRHTQSACTDAFAKPAEKTA